MKKIIKQFFRILINGIREDIQLFIDNSDIDFQRYMLYLGFIGNIIIVQTLKDVTKWWTWIMFAYTLVIFLLGIIVKIE